jgi:hypothetical protein
MLPSLFCAATNAAPHPTPVARQLPRGHVNLFKWLSETLTLARL